MSLGRVSHLAFAGEPAPESAAAFLAGGLRRAADRGWRAAWMRLASGDRTALAAAQRCGAEVLGTLVTFERELLPPRAAKGERLDQIEVTHAARGLLLRPAQERDLPRLRALAAGAYRLDRYHRDPGLDRRRVDALWAESAANAVRGRADGVWVAEREGRADGFVTLHRGRGLAGETARGRAVIGLVAVHRRAAGKGLGRALVHTAARAAARDGARILQVGTQGDNEPAMRLYAASGFRPARVWLDLRAWCRRGDSNPHGVATSGF